MANSLAHSPTHSYIRVRVRIRTYHYQFRTEPKNHSTAVPITHNRYTYIFINTPNHPTTHPHFHSSIYLSIFEAREPPGSQHSRVETHHLSYGIDGSQAIKLLLFPSPSPSPFPFLFSFAFLFPAFGPAWFPCFSLCLAFIKLN